MIHDADTPLPIVVVTHEVGAAEMRAIYDDAFGESSEVVYLDDLKGERRKEALAAADIIVAINIRRELTPDEIACLGGVRFIQVLTAGVDQIPFKALPSNVQLSGNPGVYSDAMAEHVVAMSFAAGKRLFIEHRALESGRFNQSRLNRKMAGCNCAILGFGGVGRATGRLMRALGLAVHAINRTGVSDEPVDFIGTLDDLETVVRMADIIVVALPLTRRTEGLIDGSVLSWMKDDAILVVVSRGEIVDQAALYRRLVDKPSFTACIDSWWVEPMRHGEFRLDHPILDLPNVIGSPHNSPAVPGQYLMPMRQGAANVRRFLDGDQPHHLVGDDERLG